jgi:hypothetical protein
MAGESSSPKSVESHPWPRVNGPSSVNDSKGWYYPGDISTMELQKIADKLNAKLTELLPL